MKRIGLTGGIASGKSTVAQKLRSLGAEVIDADRLAREVVLPQTPALQEIETVFGKEMITDEGTLDRKRLGALVFSDPQKRSLLDQITHPRIIALAEKGFQNAAKEGKLVAFFEAALLFEAKWNHSLDAVWVVSIPEKEQFERLVSRDGFSKEEALARIHSQMPLAEKLRLADLVIDNSGSLVKTNQQVESAYFALLAEGAL